MKKSVIFAIVVIYILAIVVVGFLGRKLTVPNPPVDVVNIKCTSDDYVAYNPDIASDKEWIDRGYAGKIELNYEQNMRILLKCRIDPANATQQDVDYISGNTQNGVVVKNEDGTAYLDILQKGTFDVTIRATDNKKTSIKIKIIITDEGGKVEGIV